MSCPVIKLTLSVDELKLIASAIAYLVPAGSGPATTLSQLSLVLANEVAGSEKPYKDDERINHFRMFDDTVFTQIIEHCSNDPAQIGRYMIEVVESRKRNGQ